MRIDVNGTPTEVAPASVAETLACLGFPDNGIATALNGDFLPAASRPTQALRDGDRLETEDHIAYLCEVMRFLIAGDDVEVSNLTRQQAFFTQHVQSWLPAMCQTLQSQPRAVFYARLAAFTEAFISVESQGFDLVA